MEIKRRLVTCTQGHIYNANANATCPFCGSPEAGATAGQSAQDCRVRRKI